MFGHVEVQDPPAFKRWPPEVVQVQRMSDVEFEVMDDYQVIRSSLPEQHVRHDSPPSRDPMPKCIKIALTLSRQFHSHNIVFLPLATKDEQGRLWASILTGNEGQTGFITSPDRHHLDIKAKIWAGDPIEKTLRNQANANSIPIENQFVGNLVAGVGVELTTRRRNKLMGKVEKIDWNHENLELKVKIDQALGNCPKYITVRDLVPNNSRQAKIQLENLNLSSNETLPDEVKNFILENDTIFLATSYSPKPNSKFSSHLGINHRGGRVGWIRIRNDGKTLVLPDFSGNRHFTSLGNLESDPHAGIVIPDFSTGDVLYLTGLGKNLSEEAANLIMQRPTKLITLFSVTGFTLVRNAIPLQQTEDSVEISPYSPPIKFLAEEKLDLNAEIDLKAKLVRVKFYSNEEETEDLPSLATFTFSTPRALKVTAGQYIVLDTTKLIGQSGYSHMARKGQESSVNDDGIRTWTISRPPTAETPNEFSITIRNVAQGRVSSRLFSFGNYWQKKQKEISENPTGNSGFVPSLEFSVLGVGGTFILPSRPNRVIMMAGGIGVTPFLAFLNQISERIEKTGKNENWAFQLLISTREPELLLTILREFVNPSENMKLDVHIFSNTLPAEIEAIPTSAEFYDSLKFHSGRITPSVLSEIVGEQSEEEPNFYLCGPAAFEASVLTSLSAVGVDETKVIRESFAY